MRHFNSVRYLRFFYLLKFAYLWQVVRYTVIYATLRTSYFTAKCAIFTRSTAYFNIFWESSFTIKVALD